MRRRLPLGTPKSIVVFAVAYLGFAICAFINNLTMLDGFLFEIAAGLGQTNSVPAFVGVLAFAVRLAFRLALIWFIVWRASNVARWLIALFALPWAWQVPAAARNLAIGNFGWVGWLFTFICLTVAILFLFAPSARTWIARKGQSVDTDRAVFK